MVRALKADNAAASNRRDGCLGAAECQTGIERRQIRHNAQHIKGTRAGKARQKKSSEHRQAKPTVREMNDPVARVHRTKTPDFGL